MEWKDVSSVIAKLAPMIATGLGGPLAGGAVTALEGVFGVKTDGTTEDKQNALVAAISGATRRSSGHSSNRPSRPLWRNTSGR